MCECWGVLVASRERYHVAWRLQASVERSSGRTIATRVFDAGCARTNTIDLTIAYGTRSDRVELID